MNIGQLDRRITIQRQSVSKDAEGAAVITWADLATVSAKKADQGGREFRSAGTLLAETTTVFTIRYFPALTTADRIRYDGVTYNIVGIGELGRREGLTLQTNTEAVQS